MAELDKILQLLAQLRPAVTTAVQLYSPPAAADRSPAKQPILKKIWVANISATPQSYTLYFDNDGTTYDETTMIAPLIQLSAGRSEWIDLDIPMNISSGSIGVKSSLANAFNFTLFGEI